MPFYGISKFSAGVVGRRLVVGHGDVGIDFIGIPSICPKCNTVLKHGEAGFADRFLYPIHLLRRACYITKKTKQ